jgi:hypothetical protein
VPLPAGSIGEACDIASGTGGANWVAWHTIPAPKTRTSKPQFREAWVARVTKTGQLTDKHRLFRYRSPMFVRSTGFRPSCPALIPAAGGSLEVVWQRESLSYAPGNRRPTITSPSQLIRVSRSANGTWGQPRPWLRASKVGYSTANRVRWLDGGAGEGILLVERRLRKGSSGLRVDELRRTTSGQWSGWLHDGGAERDLKSRKLVSAQRNLGLLVPSRSGPSLQIMRAGEQRWGPAQTLGSAVNGCNSPSDLRGVGTPAGIYASWQCSLHGVQAIAGSFTTWDGTPVWRSLIDTRLPSAEAKAAGGWPATLGALTGEGDAARISWATSPSDPATGAAPAIFEATLTPAGPSAPTTSETSPEFPPATDGATRAFEVSFLGSGSGALASDWYLLTATDILPRRPGDDPFAPLRTAARRQLISYRALTGRQPWQPIELATDALGYAVAVNDAVIVPTESSATGAPVFTYIAPQ